MTARPEFTQERLAYSGEFNEALRKVGVQSWSWGSRRDRSSHLPVSARCPVRREENRPTVLSLVWSGREPLLNLARLFLDGGNIQLAAGDLSAFAFVFDMNRVFEAFVVNLVRKYRQEILLPEMWDCDPNRTPVCTMRPSEK